MTSTPLIRKIPLLDIEHEVGDSFSFPITVESAPNVPVDVTGRTYTMVIIVPGGSNISITGDNGTPTDGVVTFSKNATEMAGLVAGTQYSYEVKYTMSGDIEVTSLKGKIIAV